MGLYDNLSVNWSRDRQILKLVFLDFGFGESSYQFSRLQNYPVFRLGFWLLLLI